MDGGEGAGGDSGCHKDIDAMQPCETWRVVAVCERARSRSAAGERWQSQMTRGAHEQVQDSAMARAPRKSVGCVDAGNLNDVVGLARQGDDGHRVASS